jgi:hypothetical protein
MTDTEIIITIDYMALIKCSSNDSDLIKAIDDQDDSFELVKAKSKVQKEVTLFE